MSLAQLSRLLPLPNEELEQLLTYGASLSKQEAAEHFRNLLGDSPQAIDFISTFNARRTDPKGTATATSPFNAQAGHSSANNSDNAADSSEVPRSTKNRSKKQKPPLHQPVARKIEAFPPLGGASYVKKDHEDDYYTGKKAISQGAKSTSAAAATSSSSQNAQKAPTVPISATPPPPQQQRTAAGYLISEAPTKSKASRSNPTTRSSTPQAKSTNTKVSITGGMPMAGASAALTDLDAAIRALEMTTNPTLHGDPTARRCNCIATKHGLQTAAPNCLSCGKVICLKEGLGPCTYCGTPLLNTSEVQAMVAELRLERGREKMAADREAHKRAEISKKPAPFSKYRNGGGGPSAADEAEAEAKAKAHRDKLLGFQAQNARRTTVRDEVADCDVSDALGGTMRGKMWSTPEERAQELKRQQKLLREMEWNAKPEYEKRRQIVSIDLVGGKVVRKMAAVERPPSPDEVDEVRDDNGVGRDSTASTVADRQAKSGGGTFSNNPLMGHMIKPVYQAAEKPEGEWRAGAGRPRKTAWRRVQDPGDDNEGVILDGGANGYSATADEPDCG